MKKSSDKKFIFIDHTADIAVKIFGKDLTELFLNAHSALLKVLTDNIKNKSNSSKQIKLTANSAEELLVDFLSEINFYLSTRNKLAVKINSLKIDLYENNFYLDCNCEFINIKKSGTIIKLEIKAVTYHNLKIEKIDGVLQTTIVLDI